MPINRENVEALKAMMRAKPRSYSQQTFGKFVNDSVAECNTECCMAGFCRIAEVGLPQYMQELLKSKGDTDEELTSFDFNELCVESGLRFLGISRYDECPSIFDGHYCWPKDLSEAYRGAENPVERVEVACRALDRLQEDGSIGRSALFEVPQL
jgi:hypothetical protein